MEKISKEVVGQEGVGRCRLKYKGKNKVDEFLIKKQKFFVTEEGKLMASPSSCSEVLVSQKNDGSFYS